MNKISKILSIVLMFSLLLGLTACGSNPTKDAEAAVTKKFDDLKALNQPVVDEFFKNENISLETQFSDEDLKKLQEIIIQKVSYEIISSEKVDNENVDVNIEVTALDMEKALNKFVEGVIEYSGTVDVNKITTEEANQKTFQILLDSINDPNLQTITNPVKVKVTKTDGNWNVNVDDALALSIFGNLSLEK